MSVAPPGPILLVEDDPIIVDIVTDSLAPLDRDVVAISDGLDVMPSLWAHAPALVILDCNLPGRSGMLLLDDIRRSAPRPSVPVLMLTGRQGSWNENAARRHGADAYLRKPFAIDLFRETVARLIGGERRAG